MQVSKLMGPAEKAVLEAINAGIGYVGPFSHGS
jgi:hypothetical protein